MGVLHRLINLRNKLQAEIGSKLKEHDEAQKAKTDKATSKLKGELAGLQKALGMVEKEYKDFLHRSG